MGVTAAPPEPLRGLAALVVKDRVGLGRLPTTQQALALGLAWACLPEGRALSEPQVNDGLRGCLAGAVAFLDTDHVELRRWLVDAGWLRRDGYGREYRRVVADALPADLRAIAVALGGIDAAAWVTETRGAHEALRVARRQAWQAAKGAKGAAA